VITCRLCGSENTREYFSQGNKDEYIFYKCSGCKLVNYDISNGLDQAKYSTAYINPFDTGMKTNVSQTKTHEYIKSKIDIQGKLLDIGCGNGRLLYLFREDGWKVRGLELSPSLAEAIKIKLDIDVDVSDFLEYHNNSGEKYDVVVLRHVLEHLPDSIRALSRINSFLRMNGYAVLEFPNIEGFDLRFKRLLKRCGVYRKTYREGYRPGHCNEFSKASFKYLASRTGFEIESWTTYSYKPIPNYVYNITHIGNKVRTIIRKIENI
jgi:2-polyprenyl-3-methyl-5-hydroxy-6-metoxy-1,4-benzoquinol methylase